MNKELQEMFEIIKKQGITKWKIASEIGIADTTFSKWLRKELTPERRGQIMDAIEKLSKGA